MLSLGLFFFPKVEKLHWVIIAVKQLPFLVLTAAVRTGDIVTHIVPENEFPAFITDAVMGLVLFCQYFLQQTSTIWAGNGEGSTYVGIVIPVFVHPVSMVRDLVW